MSDTGFDASTLEGTYVLTFAAHGGSAPLAAFGVVRFDGAGGMTGSVTENRPGPRYGLRKIVTVPFEGSYSVEASGLGAISPGDAAAGDLRFALRDIAGIGGRRVARELALVVRAVHAQTGALRTGVGFRRPADVVFDERSLRGRYNGLGASAGGAPAVAGLGMLVYDGAGGFREVNVSNVRGDSFRERRFVDGSDAGFYTVAADGTGTIAGGALVFVITRARDEGGVALAEEYGFFVRDLVPSSGAFAAGVTRRVCD